MALHEALIREMCATRLAELAYLGDVADRECLLRVSYHLSPSDQELGPWVQPASVEDLALGARKLREVALAARRNLSDAEAARASSAGTLVHDRVELFVDVLESGADLLAGQESRVSDTSRESS